MKRLVCSLISSDPPSLLNSPTQETFLDGPKSPPSHAPAAPSRTRSNKDTDHIFASEENAGLEDPFAREHSAGLLEPAKRSIFLPPPPETASTTDVLMQTMTFPTIESNDGGDTASIGRKASLNHVLTQVVVLQEFVLELVAVLQVRAAVLGDREVKLW